MRPSFLSFREKTISQTAGILYLAIAIIGGLSIGVLPAKIIVGGDAALTFQNLAAQPGLARWILTGDIAVLVMETALTVMIFRLFKNFSFTGIRIATYSRMAMAIIMGMNLINYLVPAIIVSSPEYLDSFSAEQLESLTLLFLQAHDYGVFAWQNFFAIHLFALGYVILKSALTPKWMGILMLIGGVGYGGDSFIHLAMIDSEVLSTLFSVLLVMAVISEFWFAFWLLIKGGKRFSSQDLKS